MRSTFVLFALLAFAAPALADVGPAPSCPTGQQSAYFRGRYCAPVECAANDACPSGATCEERALCLQARDPNGRDSVAVVGECENGACPNGGTCTRRKFCGEASSGAAPSPAPSTPAAPAANPAPSDPPAAGGSADSPPVPETAPSSPGRSRGCGIGSTGGSAEGALPFAVLGLGLALAFRDARRRRR
ncbi:MAG: hypothetical protein U0230_08990 [Polyangiales bacterium]